jgi:hypothetical protein
MREERRLEEDNRTFRRTVLDALAVLHAAANFSHGDCAKIGITLLALPSKQLVGLVDLLFDTALQDTTYVLSLPTSAQFSGVCAASEQRETFDIARLDQAVVDSGGEVLLMDGTRLAWVEVKPAYLPYDPSELDLRILHHTISILNAEERCYRPLAQGIGKDVAHMVPDLRFLDFSEVAKLQVPPPPLKVIAPLIVERDQGLGDISQQKIADTLRKFGIRHPKPRPRRK